MNAIQRDVSESAAHALIYKSHTRGQFHVVCVGRCFYAIEIVYCLLLGLLSGGLKYPVRDVASHWTIFVSVQHK